MSVVRSGLVVMLLAAATARAATIDTQALECSVVQSATEDSPIILGQQATRSIRFTAPRGGGAWGGILDFEEGNFTRRISLEVKKSKPKSYFSAMRLYQGGTTLFNHRILSSWFEKGASTVLYINEATLNFAFHYPDDNRKIFIQLTDPRIEGLDVVWATGDLEVEECEGPERVPGESYGVQVRAWEEWEGSKE
ncbi:hypothetical protein GWK47_043246 [Chionoecetes opilio]|uniref:Uncharacterized protein n=1 Tax=Chionoecetes opilio TaxID=41210 RepID=A0A8J4YAI8_CHIOP|nr:hypothetical protein GWK47_043246 [Chionoecetes opilio]